MNDPIARLMRLMRDRDPDTTFNITSKVADEYRLVTGRQINMPTNVMSNEEAEKADFVVCNSVTVHSVFDDNVFTTCVDCGQGIYHRPTAPKRPKKICLPCLLKREEA